MIIEIPYTPRPLQVELHTMMDEHRFNVICCHRRFGKTVAVINHLLKQAILTEKKNPRLAYIAPTYRQAKAIAFDYLKLFSEKIPNIKFHETELRADLPNGARISLLGAENYNALRGIYLDFCAMDEVSDMPSNIFPEVIRPALSDRKGSCVFISTPRGMNYFHDLWEAAATTKGWGRKMFKASETGILDDEELDAAKATMSEAQYNQEFECSFIQHNEGSVYGKELQKLDEKNKITEVPYDPQYRVSSFWDIGMHDYTSIFFAQLVGHSVHVIDYYENRGEGLPHYAHILREKEYLYEDHWGPHDLTVRELGSGKSRLEAAQELGINFRIVPRIPLEDGIHALRMLLPRCTFDKANCAKGIEALRHYHRKFDDRTRSWRDKPVHDFSSHAADAARYMAVAIDNKPNFSKPPQLRAENKYNPFEARV